MIAEPDSPKGSPGHSTTQSASTSRTPYPQERRELYDRASHNADAPVFKRVIPQAHQGFGTQAAATASTKAGLKENPAMSFVMLTDSQVVPPQPTLNGYEAKPKSKRAGTLPPDPSNDPKQSLSHQIESTTRLFEILSSHSDIDHPVCTECTDLLLSSLQARLSASTKERDAYITFLKSLTNAVPTAADVSKAQSTLNTSQVAKAQAFSELLALEKEKASLDAEIANLEAESLALDADEKSFWRSRNAFALTLSSFQNELDAVNAAYDHDTQQLERLQRTNVYNDTFCISHDGHFGTINGLRLGRLPPPHNVDWSEINAAWGTASLLLVTVAEKLGFTFRGYRIKPMGSTSRIERLEYPASSTSSATHSSTTGTTPPANVSSQQPPQQPKITSLDLFSSGDLMVGRMFLYRRIDSGMVAFLECLRQLGEFVETGGGADSADSSQSAQSRTKPTDEHPRGPPLPYIIYKDKIGDTSIKLGTSQDEAWTRACKYALTCCKFLLAHASNVGGTERRRGGD